MKISKTVAEDLANRYEIDKQRLENSAEAVQAQPPGAVPDLSVEGTIELERLKDVLYVGRPVFGQAQSVVTMFKLAPDGKMATRTQVKFGRTSVTTIEVLEGLKVADQVLLSDM